ncbi:VWA domain-containing protein [Saccharothrix obliqua]|uniref:VWA domain-containing protein n=1 Tax=Saccharothrix obliqua TaxID=2861747 RepID=UPI001C5D7759|nr:VWA domain-containing protein [Saccharothrix obliqua]MBW4722447.1 hypothetical protein [Saccharothrix obliqua]
MWLAAYKAAPQVHERDRMDPAHLVNHQVVTSLLGSPEWEELRRETVGDPVAAAMAVLAQADALRRILERTQDAQDAADAQAKAEQEAADTAAAVAAALDRAADAADEGTVPVEAADAVEQAIAAAETADQTAVDAAGSAEQALAAAAPGVRALARAAAADAAEQAREEAALMAAWGVGPGQLERMDFDERAALAQRLRDGRLGEFAALVGRFRQMATAQRARRVEHVPGEYVGITLGDDLSRVIPSEIAQLGVPELRAVFAAKYAEAGLMLYDTRGEENTGQGAIVACVDCSWSMTIRGRDGISGEAWAKAAALALLDQARNANPRRDFVAVLFASANELHVIRFPAGRPVAITDLIDLGEHFFAGGTYFQTPLSTAVEILEAEFNADGKAKGDIVLITDGECEVDENWMRAWNDAKARLDFRTFGIAVRAPRSATEPGGVLDALCDNLRAVDDLTQPDDTADLFRTI